MVTFLATEHHRRSYGTKLHCSVTEAHVYEQLVHCHYIKVSERLPLTFRTPFQISSPRFVTVTYLCISLKKSK